MSCIAQHHLDDTQTFRRLDRLERHFSGAAVLRQVAMRPVQYLRACINRSRHPVALREPDDRVLERLGICRGESLRQCRNRFWNAYARRHLR